MKIKFFELEQNLEKEIEVPEIQVPSIDESVYSLIINSYAANQRSGTKKTKSRGEVDGGGKKPWPQKHTGRARHGTTRSPLWIKGGHTFAIKPGKRYYKINARLKSRAFFNILSRVIENGNLSIVNELKFERPSSSQANDIIRRIGYLGSKVLLVTFGSKEIAYKSFRNIENVLIIPIEELNLKHLLLCDRVIFEYDAYKKLMERV